MRALLLASLASVAQCAPQSLVIPSMSSWAQPEGRSRRQATKEPQITSFHVTSTIQLRYARTMVESKLVNPDNEAQMATFNMTIPDSAFIRNFSMEVGGEQFMARVEEKEKAEETFQKAVSSGRGAGLVSQDARDTNRFTVSANLEGAQKIIFRLTYDELLERKAGVYEQAINIDLKQVVPDFRVEVFINESLPITTLKVPDLLESNAVDPTEETENSIARIVFPYEGNNKMAKIVFAPSVVEQAAAEEQGVSGKLVVRYDVDRQGQDSEVQVIDGYFVHFFVPENLKTLPKHVIFVLDTSGSMEGEKMQQLKDAMFTVLDDMKPVDSFNIITFSEWVRHWDPVTGVTGSGPLKQEHWLSKALSNVYDSDPVTEDIDPPPAQFKAVAATKENKKAAIKYVLGLEAVGGTDINAAMMASLNVAESLRSGKKLAHGVVSMVVFLSDGEATNGETRRSAIKNNVATTNSELKLPIFSVAFGLDADFSLLKDISAGADSFAKRVYEDSDAALQLENFYSEISSPLLTNLKFDYVGGMVDNSSLSSTTLRTFFKGGQYIVVGRLQEEGSGGLKVRVTGQRSTDTYWDSLTICPRALPAITDLDHKDPASLAAAPPTPGVFPCLPPAPHPQRSEAQEFMQNLHAFLNIQQLIKNDMKAEALKLAMANNFVTPLTSLVVVRPREEDSLADVEMEEEEEEEDYDYDYDYDYHSQSQFQSLPVNSNLWRSLVRPTPKLRKQTNYASLAFAAPAGMGSRNSLVQQSPQRIPGGQRRNFNFNFKPKVRTALHPKSTTTSSYEYYEYDESTSSYEYYEYNDSTTSPTTSSPAPTACTGNLTLHASTYLRGDNTTLDATSSNLEEFSDRAVSATVRGSCCWLLFSEPGLQGDSVTLSPGGDYKTTNSFGILFRDVSSVSWIFC